MAFTENGEMLVYLAFLAFQERKEREEKLVRLEKMVHLVLLELGVKLVLLDCLGMLAVPVRWECLAPEAWLVHLVCEVFLGSLESQENLDSLEPGVALAVLENQAYKGKREHRVLLELRAVWVQLVLGVNGERVVQQDFLVPMV